MIQRRAASVEPWWSRRGRQQPPGVCSKVKNCHGDMDTSAPSLAVGSAMATYSRSAKKPTLQLL